MNENPCLQDPDHGRLLRRFASDAFLGIVGQLLVQGKVTLDDLDHAHLCAVRCRLLRLAADEATKVRQYDEDIEQMLARGDLWAATAAAEAAELATERRKRHLREAAQYAPRPRRGAG